jgi:hypothetical protein
VVVGAAVVLVLVLGAVEVVGAAVDVVELLVVGVASVVAVLSASPHAAASTASEMTVREIERFM